MQGRVAPDCNRNKGGYSAKTVTITKDMLSTESTSAKVMPNADSESSYPPELLRVEETVKENYLNLVRNLSYLEQKKFNKVRYADIVCEDMSKLLPNFSKSRLKETAHYVSNSLKAEAERHIHKTSRRSSSSKENKSEWLSSSVSKNWSLQCGKRTQPTIKVKALMMKMLVAPTMMVRLQKDPAYNDDTLTQLKQTATVEIDNSTHEHVKQTTARSKCCDSCTIYHKAKADMIRCSFCINEPVGIWICEACREVPQNI